MSISRKRKRRNLAMRKERVMPDRSSLALRRGGTVQKRLNRNKAAQQPIGRQPRPRRHTLNRSFDDKRLMAIANNHIHAIKPRNLLRSTLRIAARNYHPSIRICPPHLPQKSARVTVRLGGHATSVQNHNCRIPDISGPRKPSLPQARGNRFAIRPARPAAKVLNVIFFHVVQSINAVDARWGLHQIAQTANIYV